MILLYTAILPWVVQTMPTPNGFLLLCVLIELLICCLHFQRDQVLTIPLLDQSELLR